MRATVHGIVLLLVFLVGCGAVVAQEDIAEDPPSNDTNGPGGGDDPSLWPGLSVSFHSSGLVTFVQGEDTGIRYLQREDDGTYTVNLGTDDVLQAVWRDPVTVPNVRIRNSAAKASLELTWYDAASRVIRVDVLAPGEEEGMLLDDWARVEIRDAPDGLTY